MRIRRLCPCLGCADSLCSSGTFRNPQPLALSLKSIAGTNGRRTAVQIGSVLQYKLEAYCGVSLSPKLRSQRGTTLQMGGRTAVQIGGVPPVLFRQVVRVGGIWRPFTEAWFWAHLPDCLRLFVVGKWLSKPPSTTNKPLISL